MINAKPRRIAQETRGTRPASRTGGEGKKTRENAFSGVPPGGFRGPDGRPVAPTPWLTPSATIFLDGILTSGSSVLETGAGGSTLWIAARVRDLVSFEHDPGWYRVVRGELARRGIVNVTLVLDPEYPTKGINAEDNQFDVLLVDGRGRVKTIRSAMNAVRKGGWIFLDNAERARYHPIVEELDARCSTKVIFLDGWEARAWQI